jgi:hypothetical protein
MPNPFGDGLTSPSTQLTKSTSEIRDAFSVYDVEAGIAKNRISWINCLSGQEATYG